MSNSNLFEPLAQSLFDVGRVTLKAINAVMGLNTIDFKTFFKEVKLCNESKEYPKIYNIYKNESYKTYRFDVPTGIGLDDFIKNKESLYCFMRAEEKDIIISRCKGRVDIKVSTGKRLIKEYNPEDHKRKDFKIPLGYNLETMEIVYWDIVKASNTHCYIAGSSGGGKSIALRLILCHLVSCKSKRDIEFSIINTKRVDLKAFKDCKHTIRYMTGIEGVEDFLESELEEMERRYKLIDKCNCDDLAELRSQGHKIPYRLIVVEEISSYKGNKAYQRAIELISSQGRGAGMILTLVTQLPSHEIMPNTIKCNINTTIGLMTKDSIRSEIIAGPDAGLEKLKGNGHAKLFDRDHEGVEYQGFNITKDTMYEILEENKRAALAVTNATPGDNKKLSE